MFFLGQARLLECCCWSRKNRFEACQTQAYHLGRFDWPRGPYTDPKSFPLFLHFLWVRCCRLLAQCLENLDRGAQSQPFHLALCSFRVHWGVIRFPSSGARRQIEHLRIFQMCHVEPCSYFVHLSECNPGMVSCARISISFWVNWCEIQIASTLIQGRRRYLKKSNHHDDESEPKLECGLIEGDLFQLLQP